MTRAGCVRRKTTTQRIELQLHSIPLVSSSSSSQSQPAADGERKQHFISQISHTHFPIPPLTYSHSVSLPLNVVRPLQFVFILGTIQRRIRNFNHSPRPTHRVVACMVFVRLLLSSVLVLCVVVHVVVVNTNSATEVAAQQQAGRPEQLATPFFPVQFITERRTRRKCNKYASEKRGSHGERVEQTG